jgi:hypothetical protein
VPRYSSRVEALIMPMPRKISAVGVDSSPEGEALGALVVVFTAISAVAVGALLLERVRWAIGVEALVIEAFVSAESVAVPS